MDPRLYESNVEKLVAVGSEHIEYVTFSEAGEQRLNKEPTRSIVECQE